MVVPSKLVTRPFRNPPTQKGRSPCKGDLILLRLWKMETNSAVTVDRHSNTESDEESAAHLCEQARRLWLSENSDEDDDDDTMKRVEQLYRRVWSREDSLDRADVVASCDDRKASKKPRVEASANSDNDAESCLRQQAGEKLALILLQSGRETEADQILTSLGYTCRLSSSVLNYDTATTVDTMGTGHATENKDIPCRIYDDFLSDAEQQMLQTVFLDPANCYWTDHSYTVEPPSPYFSYLIPLRSVISSDSGIAAFVSRLQNVLQPHFPVKNASYCEMWAHNRPHATGHQFHFDSDNEGCCTKDDNVIRNPICSCVVYLTDDNVGGPSVVTNQRLASRNLATAGWMCSATTGRMLAFDGKVLHGVVPGKAGVNKKLNADEEPAKNSRRRVSVMFAFWRKIRVRDAEAGAGAARPFPTQPLWAQQLRRTQLSSSSINGFSRTPISVQPNPLDHVYESTVNGKPWTRKMGLPDYEQIFQGF